MKPETKFDDCMSCIHRRIRDGVQRFNKFCRECDSGEFYEDREDQSIDFEKEVSHR